MKDLDILIKEKYKNEEEVEYMKNITNLFLRGEIDFNDLPFKVKLLICEWEGGKNCAKLDANVSAQIIVAKRSVFVKNVLLFQKKLHKWFGRGENGHGKKNWKCSCIKS
jgi:hypothetical protein